jgi:hypothetical protein
MKRALRVVATHAFAAFGVCAVLLQSYQAVWDKAPFPGHARSVVSVVAIVSIGCGFLQIRPRRSVARTLKHPRCRIEVVPADLFDQRDFHLVVGFTDTFDTDPTDDRIVHRSSVQAQFLRRIYNGETARLDDDLHAALAKKPAGGTISRAAKAYGKLKRYPVGTVAVLGSPRRHFFCVAYSSMSSDLVARASVDDLWSSLARLWDAVYDCGQRQPLAMPVVGTGLARLDALDREALLRLILLSFVAASRERIRTETLRVVIPSGDFRELNRLEIQAFLDLL